MQFLIVFTGKSIKHVLFQKMIFNIDNPDKKAIEFDMHINKICLYLFIYIEGYNKLEKGMGNIMAIDDIYLAML